MTLMELHTHPTQRPDDIIAADERHVPLARKVLNGLTGAIILLLGGLLVLGVVLWKSP